MKRLFVTIAIVLLGCSIALAQDLAPPAGGPQAPQPPQPPDPPAVHARFGREHGMMLHGRAAGKWWKDSELAQKIGLSDEQISQIEKIFQDHRLKLIDLRASLEKQEVQLEPLVEADRPDEAQVLAQIDRVAQARAELEKANARMMLGIRGVLTVDQWKKLRAEREMGPSHSRGKYTPQRFGQRRGQPPSPPSSPSPPNE